MLPDLPKKWIFGEKVMLSESNMVEFKEVSLFSGLFINKSMQLSALPKYRDTLIGFLNGGGGYLIMGVRNDRTIIGVGDLTTELLDRFKLWVDSTFNVIVHKDGRYIDPSQTSLRVIVFPVHNANNKAHIICVEAIHTGIPLDIMTRAGTIIYRLNASNYRIITEPIYRKRDVQGMICAIQGQMQSIINDKHKALKVLQEKHKDELEAVLKAEKEKNEEHVSLVIKQISDSLYLKYRDNDKNTLCNRIMKFLFIK
jgi:hypothetical protein